MPGAWRAKRDQGHGPGDYEVTRLMSVVIDKEKNKKNLVNMPLYERIKYGMIPKVLFSSFKL